MIEHDSSSGQISDGDIRYVLLRADVLMRIADHLPEVSSAAFLRGLEESVSARASGSFEHYKANGAHDLTSMLNKCRAVASRLGWGLWTTSMREDGGVNVIVANSPFASGFGRSESPVCGAISGALRAVFSVQGESSVVVHEEECAAQGALTCRFHVDRNSYVCTGHREP